MDHLEGFVCKTLDYKDSSKILYLYTELGNISVVARGVKKLNNKNRFLAQNGNLIRFTKTRGEFPSLKEGELINDYQNTKLDLDTYTLINHILELVHYTIDEYSDHVKMFDFLKRLFSLFNQGYNPETLTFVFELKLLYFLGYGLHFKGCSVCDDHDDLVYSISNGGLICRKHLKEHQEFFDDSIYNTIKTLYYTDINEYQDIELSKNERIMLRHIIDMTIDEFISYKTKSREIMKQIMKY